MIEDTSPGYVVARIETIDESVRDHEQRIRLLERFQWRSVGAAATGGTAGGLLLELLLHFMR